METTFKTTINNLRGLILDPNTERMNRSTLVGFLGELLVLQKLKDEKITCNLVGNQSGYDIDCSNGIKIDVKTSRVKDEYISYTGKKMWGWALVQESKRKPITCSHFICVQLDEKLQVVNYYVIRREHVHQFPKPLARFSKVKKTVVVLKRNKEIEYQRSKLKEQPQKMQLLFSESKTLISSNIALRIPASKAISRALI